MFPRFVKGYCMKIKPSALLLSAALVIFANFPLPAAEAVSISDDSGATISYDGLQLFSETNIQPGDIFDRSVTITNSADTAQQFTLSLDGTLKELGEVMLLTPIVNGTALWAKSMRDIHQSASDTTLITVLPHSQQSVSFQTILPTTVGNEYQGKTTGLFSLIFKHATTYAANLDQFSQSRSPAALGSSPGSSPTATDNSPTSGSQLLSTVTFQLNAPAQTAAPGTSETPATPPPTDGAVLGSNQVAGSDANGPAYANCWFFLLFIIPAFLLGYLLGRRHRQSESEDKPKTIKTP